MKIQRRNNKNNRRHLSIKSLALLAVFLFSVVAPIAGTWGAKARAAGSALAADYGIAFKNGVPDIKTDSYKLEWIDAGQLQITFKAGKDGTVRKEMFVPKNIKDNGKSSLDDQRSDSGMVAEYEISGWGGGNCYATAETTSAQPNDLQEITKMEVDIDFRSNTLNDCVDGGNNNQTIDTKNPGLSIAWWQWVDEGKIESISGSRYKEETFEKTEPKLFPEIFVRTSNPESTCNDRLWVRGNEVRFYELAKDKSRVAPKDIQAPNCKFSSAADTIDPPTSGPYKGFGREIAGIANKSKPKGTGVGNSGGSTVDPGDQFKCEIRLTNPLTWFFCPMIDTARELVNSLNGVINDLMRLPTDKLFDTTNPDNVANQFYASWSGFRYIAMGLLVIIALIMVLSQAIGVGPFDAYTIRKVLPRLLAAVVLVSLSWPLMKLAVDITNGVGHSVSGLIYGPFKDGLTTTTTSSPVMGAVLAGAIATGFVFGLVGLLAFVATAALSMLSGVATLIFREMLIMFLVVVAPVAIICSILPNTQIVWKKWSDYFLRALIVFPIFSGVIAIGQVFAVIGQQLHGDSLGPIIAFVGYFGPYFMLPKIFAMSGGAVAAVGSVAQKATAGMRGGLSTFRSNKAKQNWADTKASNRFKGTGALSRRASSVLANAAIVGTGRAGIRPSRLASRTRSIRSRESLAQANELLEKSPEMMAVASDDHLLRATRDGRSRAEIEGMLVRSGRFGRAGSAELGAAVSAVESAQRSGSAAAVGVAATLGLSRTGTGYDTHADMFEAISGSAGGDVLLEQAMLGSMRSSSEKARRFDLATGGHVDQAEAMADLRNGTRTREQVNTAMRRASFQAGGVHTLVSGRSAPFAEMITQLGTDFDGAMTSGDTATATEYASQITSLRGAMGSASPDNRAAIMALLTHVGVDPAAIRPETGQPFSTDEQLGVIIHRGREDEVSQRTTQEIRTRAGLYDAGGGTTTPEQQRERQQRPPGQT